MTKLKNTIMHSLSFKLNVYKYDLHWIQNLIINKFFYTET